MVRLSDARNMYFKISSSRNLGICEIVTGPINPILRVCPGGNKVSRPSA